MVHNEIGAFIHHYIVETKKTSNDTNTVQNRYLPLLYCYYILIILRSYSLYDLKMINIIIVAVYSLYIGLYNRRLLTSNSSNDMPK